jgi:hypothetical protein
MSKFTRLMAATTKIMKVLEKDTPEALALLEAIEQIAAAAEAL